MEKRAKLPNFFIGIDALNCLLSADISEGTEDIDLTFDFIDLPYWFSFRSDAQTQTLKVYTQMEMYNKDESFMSESGSLVMDRETEQATVKATQALSDNMGAFYFAAKKLGDLIQEKGLQPLYDGLDPEEAGILLTENKGELNWKVVSGRERPDLTIQTMFGGVTKGRPYMDDFWERSELDDMDLDEKTEAAEDGNTTAMNELAMLYLNGDDDMDVEPDPEKAVYWFNKLAETGDSNAMFNLGLLYAKGHGVNRDFKKAAEWMGKAADAGDDDAPALIEEYSKLADSVSKAEAGDAQAQADLAEGLMRLGGSLDQAGEEDDYAESVKWAKLAVEQGNADAMWVLALAYEHGRGVEEDKETAIKYYKKGAELGNAACQHSLGCYYARGDYLKQDNKKAFELFQKSAAQGYGLAMKDLGRCYQFGNGCMGNMKTALEWYTKASEVLDDPELDQRVAAFSSLADVDPTWGEDYPGEDEFDEDDEEYDTVIEMLEDGIAPEEIAKETGMSVDEILEIAQMDAKANDDLPNGVFDATETMRKNLEAAGKDSSDEAFGNMSVEEAYAAFFGNFDDEEDE